MYTSNAITLFHELVGPSTYQFLPSGNYTIVGVSVQQSGTASESIFQCGSTTFVKNYGKDFPYNTINYNCNNTVSITKTGQDSASFILTYIPYVSTGNYSRVEIASNSAKAIGDTAFFIWIALGILIFLEAIHVGLYIFRK